MRLQLEGKTEDDVKVSLKVVQEDNSITISDSKVGWDIVTLKVKDNKVVLIKWQGIEDANYDTDKKGRIVEVEE